LRLVFAKMSIKNNLLSIGSISSPINHNSLFASQITNKAQQTATRWRPNHAGAKIRAEHYTKCKKNSSIIVVVVQFSPSNNQALNFSFGLNPLSIVD
jgi:hypothetical protein